MKEAVAGHFNSEVHKEARNKYRNKIESELADWWDSSEGWRMCEYESIEVDNKFQHDVDWPNAEEVCTEHMHEQVKKKRRVDDEIDRHQQALARAETRPEYKPHELVWFEEHLLEMEGKFEKEREARNTLEEICQDLQSQMHALDINFRAEIMKRKVLRVQ